MTSGTEIYLHKFANHVAGLSRILTNLIIVTTMDKNWKGFKNEEWVDKAEGPGLAHRIVYNSENCDSHFC